VLSITGQALVRFGRAFCNVATAQEALGRSLGSTFIIALQRFLDQIKDYEVERKKLETRRWDECAHLCPGVEFDGIITQAE
jgi:SWI/SNF-related matrix-associated actin-dependent regulator of chromatin subfamily D